MSENALTPFKRALVRIYGPFNTVVGAGFLVYDRYLLTCAHVVAAALGISEDTQDMPENLIEFDFPLLRQNKRELFPGRVIFWQSKQLGKIGEDIAGLELIGSLPPNAQPVNLVLHQEFSEHHFTSFGFPDGSPDGIWSEGKILDENAAGWLQIEDTKVTGYRIQRGFSGAPVWDENLKSVIGMVVAEDTDEDRKVAYLIPTQVLKPALDFLRNYELFKILETDDDDLHKQYWRAYHVCQSEGWVHKPETLVELIQSIQNMPVGAEGFSKIGEFVARLIRAKRMPEDKKISLNVWAMRQVLEFQDVLASVEFEHQAAQPLANPHLMVWIEPVEKKERERYRVKVLLATQIAEQPEETWRFESLSPNDEWEAHEFDWNDIPKQVGSLIVQARIGEAYNIDDVVIEFFLPPALLNHAVEQWILQDGYGPIGGENKVVLRSQERLAASYFSWNKQKWRSAWKKLNQLQDKPVAAVITSGDDDCNLLKIELKKDGIVGCHLTRADNLQIFLDVVCKTTAPVALWLRRNLEHLCNGEPLKEVLVCTLSELPEQVRQVRAEAYIKPEALQHQEVGAHLALLWENPYRLPPNDPLIMP